MSEKENRLPPIIMDYIEKLNGKGSTSFQRENYCMILEGVISACTEAVSTYKMNSKLFRENRRR